MAVNINIVMLTTTDERKLTLEKSESDLFYVTLNSDVRNNKTVLSWSMCCISSVLIGTVYDTYPQAAFHRVAFVNISFKNFT